MAGFNTRFHDVGFDLPKYLLPWDGETVINKILQAMLSKYKFKKIMLIANQRDIYFKNKLLNSVKKNGLTQDNIVYIGDTAGQAHTAAIAAQLEKDDELPICVYNADTIIYNRDFNLIEKDLLTGEAHIDVFIANSKKYCYVRAKNRLVYEIAEKKQISSYATSGLYCFKNSQVYLDSYHEILNNYIEKEMYVSDVLLSMLKNEKKIFINDFDQSHETIVLGTPEEYGLEITKKTLR